MWDRLFGRGKQELSAEPTCAACGRTLLPGEWAQTVVREDGAEEVVCSLCAQAHDYASSADAHDATATDFEQAIGFAPTDPAGAYAAEPIAVTGRPQQSRGRTPHDDSDSFWRALQEKDAEIARLQAEIVRLETQNQQRTSELTDGAGWAPAATVATQWAVEPSPAADQWPAEPAQWGMEQPAVEAPQWAPDDQPAAEATQWAVEPSPAVDQWPAEPAQWGMEQSAVEAPQWAPDDQPAAEAVQWPTAPAAEAAQWAPDDQPAAAEVAQWAAESAPADVEDPGAETAEWVATAQVDQVQPPAESPPTAAFTAAAAVTDEWTGGAQIPAGEWPAVAPLEAAAGNAAVWPEETPDRSAIVDMPTEPLAMQQAAVSADSDFCPACDTDEMPVVASAATADDDDATVQIPVAAAAQQIVFEPQPEPADLHVLERGADLFNVSPMPHKVAESNDLLGLPAVHLSSQGDLVTALFLWSMAWYEYRIDLANGDVILADRGYDNRPVDRPNGTTKPDGTVQLAPLPARRAVVQPAPLPDQVPSTAPAVDAPIAAEPQPILPGKGDIISKSLKGQRTDDEGVAWDEMGARDFDWGR